MSNLIKKVVAGFSTFALAASMLVMPVANTAHAAMAGEVYKTTDGTVWFITSNMTKRPFTSAGAFLSYGFLSFSQVKDADASVTALSTGDFIAPQDGRIFCATETKATDVKGECSLITGGKKAAFTSSTVFTGQGYSFARAYYGDSSFLEKTSNVDNASAQHRPGTLINNNGTIQMVVSGGLWGTPSMDVFNSWGWNIADVVPANSADVLLSQTGVIPARMAGQLVPTATTTPPSEANCNDLDGTTGSITASALSDYNNEEVGEGEEEVPVMAFEIEADNDSDIAVTSVKVEFDENGAGSTDLDDHASEVVVMLNGDVVGSADVEDFTEGVTGTWTKTISLDCAAVAADETEEFVIAIDGNSTIDSNDQSEAWIADVVSVRFEDGDGVTTTEDVDGDNLEKTFTWESFASASDIELNASLTDDADDINDSHVIDIDDVDDTDDVEILAFSLENKGDVDVTINDIPVVVTAFDNAAGALDESTILLGATLWYDGDQISSDTVVAGGALVFEDLDMDLDAGDTADFVVAVDIQDTTGATDNGDTLQATLTVAGIDADDSEGDALAGGDLTGSAVGETHGLFDRGIMVELVEVDQDITSTSDGTAGVSDAGTFLITFDATAFDSNVYIDKTAPDATGGATESDLGITGTGTVVGTITSPSGATEGTDGFLIEEGTTERFSVTVNITATTSGFFAVELDSILYALTDVDGDIVHSFGLTDYKTGQIFLRDF